MRPDGEVADGGDAGPSDESCQANLELYFPNGTSSTSDYCQRRQIEAEYEFDLDAPPEVRNATLRLFAATEAEVDCYVEIRLPGVCTEGVYLLGEGGNTARVVTFDCAGVDDAFEGDYIASTGYVRVDEFSAGTTPGFFVNRPLLTTFNGYISFRTAEGIDVSGAFTAREEILGVDAEQAECASSGCLTDADCPSSTPTCTQFDAEAQAGYCLETCNPQAPTCSGGALCVPYDCTASPTEGFCGRPIGGSGAGEFALGVDEPCTNLDQCAPGLVCSYSGEGTACRPICNTEDGYLDNPACRRDETCENITRFYDAPRLECIQQGMCVGR